jgi:putative peptide maturation dehydrogenase
MANVRRTPYAFLYIEDDFALDVASLIRGEAPRSAGEAQIVGVSVLTGERCRLRRDELELLLAIPASRWVEAGEWDATLVRSLVDKGLLVSDTVEAPLAALRERDARLSANEWNLYAAVYHYMTRWAGVRLSDGEEEATALRARSRAVARAHVDAYGAPPGAFAGLRPSRTVPLPRRARDGALYRSLLARRTARSFDPEKAMTLEQLDTVLQYVFGCHGYARNAAGVLCIKRTSPSGGGLHPIEVYPIIASVAGVDPGIYHYDPRAHSLGLLSALAPAEGRRLATSFMCGQGYFGAANVSFVLTARFYRNHWKYRRHQKAYAGILMDAAHLSQTLYIVGAELGLGTFVTVAINGGDIEERLGLDGVSEGVIAMLGCGITAPGPSPLEPQFSTEPPDE